MKIVIAALALMEVAVVSALGDQEYYNILALEGDGLESLVVAYILDEAEKYAYTYCDQIEECKMPEYSGHDQRKALKDLFNMTAGVSSSALITAGISIQSPEDPSKPSQFANTLIQLYGVKSPDLEKYTSASHSSYLLFSVWLFIVVFCSYHYGQIKFNHVNSTKSYTILETIIDSEIEQKRKKDSESHQDRDQPQSQKDDEQIYIF